MYVNLYVYVLIFKLFCFLFLDFIIKNVLILYKDIKWKLSMFEGVKF